MNFYLYLSICLYIERMFTTLFCMRDYIVFIETGTFLWLKQSPMPHTDPVSVDELTAKGNPLKDSGDSAPMRDTQVIETGISF